MNFIEFATKNVIRNIRAYFAYFLSSTISASLLFSFTMVVFHPNLKSNEIPDYLIRVLQVTEVIAYLVLFFFVFYSVSVFLKSRYSEFGTLYILGTSKSQIRKLIFMENTIISTVAGIAGIIIGLIFSKLFLMITSRLLGIKVLEFYIPIKAIIINFFAFGIMGVLISMFASFIVKENEVLKLLKGTRAPKKEPKTSPILAMSSLILLGIGYYLAITAVKDNVINLVIPITSMVILATYLLFSEFNVFAIKLLKNNRYLYRKNITLLWVSNLYYKIKDNTRMFFLITITTAIAFTSIGGIYAFWRDVENQVEMAFPHAFYYSIDNKNENEETSNSKSTHEERINFIKDSLKNNNIQYSIVEGYIKPIILDGSVVKMGLINESTYKELANALGIEPMNIKEGEALVGGPLEEHPRNTIDIGDKVVKVTGKVKKRIMPALYEDVYIVKDDLYNSINLKAVEQKFYSFHVENYIETLDISKTFQEKYNGTLNEPIYIFLSKAGMLEDSKVNYGTVMFLAIILGIIFFVTTGSFVYNKLYMDTEEDKKKYEQLNKIGLTYGEIKKISTIEIGVLFLLPYIVAVIHGLFALGGLKNAFHIEVTSAAFLVMGSFLLIQVIYFLIIRGKYLSEIRQLIK